MVATKRGAWKVADGKVLYLGSLSKPDTATLQLSLRAPDRQARAGTGELSRVGIPAEPGVSAGDERVGRFELPELGLAIPNLFPGTYRVVTDAHAARAPDLVPFEVKLPRTEIVLDVVPPRERESFLDLVDMDGKPFEAAELESGGRRGKMRRPSWFHPRVKTEKDGSQTSTGFDGGFSESKSDNLYVKVVRGPRGFALGRDLEDSQLFESSRSFDLRIPGHGEFAGSVPCDGPEALYFRSLLVEKGRFEGLFKMPDESPLDLEHLFVSTPLEPDVQPRPPEWWLDVPVTVSIRAPGCKPLKIEFRPRDGLPKPRGLERAQ